MMMEKESERETLYGVFYTRLNEMREKPGSSFPLSSFSPLFFILPFFAEIIEC